MSEFPTDIYTEPSNLDFNTLANLGPCVAWLESGRAPRDLTSNRRPKVPNSRSTSNGSSFNPSTCRPTARNFFYGLRYWTHIVKPDQVKTYHDQIGYWLWEPATGAVIHSLAIPHAQAALAAGTAAVDATSFEVSATRGRTDYGICSTPFLEHAFRTDSFRIRVTINPDGTWSYFEDTVLIIPGVKEPFHHTDRNTLTRIAEPTPNPIARR